MNGYHQQTSDAMLAATHFMIHTERLVLRKPELADAQSLFEGYTQDIEVARYMVWRPHTEIGQTQTFIDDCIRRWESGQAYPLILALQNQEHRAIGMLDARLIEGGWDIGYVLARAHWGQGLMPEAIMAFMRNAIRLRDKKRIQATCDIDNMASQRTLEKCGFSRKARLESHTLHPNVSEIPRPCYLYSKMI